MSYITEIKGEEHRLSLIHKQDKLLAEIRKIIGNKKFEYSDAFLKEHNPTIGVGCMAYGAITKKYIYVNCFLQHNNNKDCTEWGALIKKFPIYYNKYSGKFVNKVELDDLFIEDLEEILRDIKFFFWWENNVNLPKLKKAYEDSLKYRPTFNKLKLSAEDIESFENL